MLKIKTAICHLYQIALFFERAFLCVFFEE
ncbi:hypothetical protein SAMN04488493_10212 [Xylanibacter ruminicola]|nr:hypothetical protein SAMN04488493_10212 [Xylanibacter ruminicola]